MYGPVFPVLALLSLPWEADYQVHGNNSLFGHLDFIIFTCEHGLDFSGKKCVRRSCKCGQDMLGVWNPGNKFHSWERHCSPPPNTHNAQIE